MVFSFSFYLNRFRCEILQLTARLKYAFRKSIRGYQIWNCFGKNWICRRFDFPDIEFHNYSTMYWQSQSGILPTSSCAATAASESNQNTVSSPFLRSNSLRKSRSTRAPFSAITDHQNYVLTEYVLSNRLRLQHTMIGPDLIRFLCTENAEKNTIP